MLKLLKFAIEKYIVKIDIPTAQDKSFSAKIFGIGLNKTGTTTLGSVLKDLGKKTLFMES